MDKININSSGLYDLDCEFLGESLKEKAVACIQAQKKAAIQSYSSFSPCEDALDRVSESALNAIIADNIDIHGVATDSTISNVIMFGAKHIDKSINDHYVEQQRIEVDKIIKEKLLDIFTDDSGNIENQELTIVSSGHFWYPQGAFMSWHTNSQVPGWRVYINYAEQENQSFFRYQDDDNNVITLNDKQWNLRIFKITEQQPLWHCVYSNTNRFSLGYMVKIKPKPNLLQKIKRKLQALF
ncbi:hypothetical protein tinsulaeT_26410 [Thalassotalea insulae]|uniref:Uncharacterized protein n=1 Tax=Thalassotalea insulae TaxID=2056778 RepID=A0ABQ6GTN8_9GAMM|nr:hypothetical protein [Thalassotalea insulae]GLX79301.1 hypothetical protein tinsulaeT_26410 [Thalassotalea insulae]